MQKEASRVFDNLQDNIFLLAQFITATRKQKPFAMGMYVISEHHTELASVMSRFQSR